MPRDICEVIERVLKIIPEGWKAEDDDPFEDGPSLRESLETVKNRVQFYPPEAERLKSHWADVGYYCGFLPHPETCDWAMEISKIVRGVE